MIKEDERTSMLCINNPILYSELVNSDKHNKTENVTKSHSVGYPLEVFSKDVSFGKTIYGNQTSNYDARHVQYENKRYLNNKYSLDDNSSISSFLREERKTISSSDLLASKSNPSKGKQYRNL